MLRMPPVRSFYVPGTVLGSEYSTAAKVSELMKQYILQELCKKFILKLY
jgi:hypothetical protein